MIEGEHEFCIGPASLDIGDGLRKVFALLMAPIAQAIEVDKGCADHAGIKKGAVAPFFVLSKLTAVTTLKFVNLTCGVEHFLLARIERVAVRANLDVQVLANRRARLEVVAAAASNSDLFVIWMDVCFHGKDSKVKVNREI